MSGIKTVFAVDNGARSLQFELICDARYASLVMLVSGMSECAVSCCSRIEEIKINDTEILNVMRFGNQGVFGISGTEARAIREFLRANGAPHDQ